MTIMIIASENMASSKIGSCGYPYDLNIQYTSYGPFSMIIITLFVLPVNVLNAVWADVEF